MNPQFPLYIPSKGRSDASRRLTIKALELMEVVYHVIVEGPEVEAYTEAVNPEYGTVLELDPAYQRDYDTFDLLGDTKSKGPGAARNFAWDHAVANGHAWHWVMDDNIRGFWRAMRINGLNQQVRVTDGTVFRCMEDFCLRYRNISMAGPNYFMFAPRRQKLPPYVPNTRIYSCNLIRNDTPYRWRGRYNEDTDISLRMLKDGWCTIQFNAFLQWKMQTQFIKGGNTAEFYAKHGTIAKSRMQVAMHPDVSRLVWKWGRWHHEVDYRPFRKNRLVLRAGVVIPEGNNEYGMQVVEHVKQ